MFIYALNKFTIIHASNSFGIRRDGFVFFSFLKLYIRRQDATLKNDSILSTTDPSSHARGHSMGVSPESQ